jgi:hypothetical protein
VSLNRATDTLHRDVDRLDNQRDAQVTALATLRDKRSDVQSS